MRQRQRQQHHELVSKHLVPSLLTDVAKGASLSLPSEHQMATEELKPRVSQKTLPSSSSLSMSSCPYQHFGDLKNAERYPKKGERHMIQPPEGGKVTLICCQTTSGPMNLVARERWAPLGANRFVSFVRNGYFGGSSNNDGKRSSTVPMMRCLKNFLCQFGLNGDPEKNRHISSLSDDPNWLPKGPKFKKNQHGVKRFAQGYLAYAGAGPNSRGNQWIVSLHGNGPLGGGSPWEVPFGEVVGDESFRTLSKLYTGYGEKGPPQGLLRREGVTKEVRQKWPLLDYITHCSILDEETQDNKSD